MLATARFRSTVAPVGILFAGIALGLAGCANSQSSNDATTSNSSPSSAASSPSASGSPSASALPSDWPKSAPQPSGLKLTGAQNSPTGISASWVGDGDPAAIERQLNSGYKDGGWTKGNTFGGGSAGTVTLWTNGSETMQVIVDRQGSEVAVYQTLIRNYPS